MSLRQQLKNGEKKIGVWGVGYIGYSSMAFFAKEGVATIGFDTSFKRVEDVNTEGKCVVPNMDYWIGFDVKPLVKQKLIYASNNWQELISPGIPVHLIDIPTEKEGKPYFDILIDVLTKIFTAYKKAKSTEPPLLIIESTLTPNSFEEVIFPLAESLKVKIGRDVLMGAAPRRDWFVSPDKTMKTLPRVVGGTDKYTTDLMAEVLGIVCDDVRKASNHRIACMVKSVENAYRHIGITYTNQLSLAYPDVDINEVSALAGTKWNVNQYHASLGCGGYCIPLAPQYVLSGASHPEQLTILSAALETDFSQPQRVAKSIINRGYKKIGILGLGYTKDLHVSTLSPSIALAKEFKKLGVEVKVSDPLFSSTEIKEITGADSFEFPTGMNQFDAIIIQPPHTAYKAPHSVILSNLSNCKFILDNMGVWKDINFGDKIEYREVGAPYWLKSEAEEKSWLEGR
jgi:nucleotide sugar dehydrogenase